MTSRAAPIGKPDILAIVAGRHRDPFSILGLHQVEGHWVVRVFIPGAEVVHALTLDGAVIGGLERRHDEGFFEGPVALEHRQAIRIVAGRGKDTWTFIDPYAFGPVLGSLDDYYLAEGTHLRLYDRLGAHAMRHEGVDGVHFAVWAPSATRVSVVADFNGWDGRRHPMRLRPGSGVWEIFIPDAQAGQRYKYELLDGTGGLLPLKSDPFGFSFELRPDTASRIAATTEFKWTDASNLADLRDRDHRRRPMAIYEVHLGSWRRRPDGGFLSYEELAEQLIPYVIDLGFTHIELLPISEHPYDPSWGYQPTGLYAPTSRFGEPEAFARFVDRAHGAGLGVILDWVPAHFPTDAHGLSRFDGTALYEHDDPRQGFHPDWNTAIYNFGRKEVRAFLVNNALFWIERYHLDGLRVDAVASMLYLDYSRREGEWIPNQFGGRENLDAISFLRHVNVESYGASPGIITIAEESTAFPKVSHPVHEGGLGFGFKWNMGFMHDTLRYLGRDPVHRRHHHNELTFGLLYAHSENYVLPLSHDEVVHGKGSLLAKMAGDQWQKFATLRAYFAFMWAYPGKKLLFMGQEMAPPGEWSEARSLDWHLLDQEPHRGVQHLVRDLNRLYREVAALHARDCEYEGFEWLIVDDAQNSVLAWARRGDGSTPQVAVVSNFAPMPREGYVLPLPRPGRWREILNTDAAIYGGSGKGNLGGVVARSEASRGKPASAHLLLPPLATVWFVFAEEGE